MHSSNSSAAMTPNPEDKIQDIMDDQPNDVTVDHMENGTKKRHGLLIEWTGLTKTVEISSESQGLGASFAKKSSVSKRMILNGLSGHAAPGKILGCMGPSGSGKTSLLNILSGRSAHQQGILSVDHRPIRNNDKRWMAQVAYVKQQDIFFDHLTVRDQLLYTALLRSKTETDVDWVLQTLRLQKVAESSISTVSGGERKRVNIGTELLTDPSVLLCDEPTSGLDSTSAVLLINLLRTLAADHGKTVITTIHQPSSALFRSFDQILMLSEGSVVYFGTPMHSLDFLSEHGMACPPGYNAADHWMDLLVTQDNDTLSAEKLVSAWNHAEKSKANERDSPKSVAGDLVAMFDDAKASKYTTSWWTQFKVLTHRALKNSRSAIFTPLNLIKSFALGAVSGLVWFQTDYTEANLNDIRSFFFFTMTFWVFDAMFTALTAFPSERKVILKERASQSYRLSAYFLAKTTADAPVRLILPLIYMIVSFWMAQISNDVSVFFGTMGVTLLSVLSGEALGLFIGAAVYDLQRGLTIMTVYTLFLMLMGGFFVEDVPVFIAWGKYLSPFKYAFDSALRVVFNKDFPCDGSGALPTLCDNQDAVSPEAVLEAMGVQGSLAFNVGLLIVLSTVPRYFAYVSLRLKKEADR